VACYHVNEIPEKDRRFIDAIHKSAAEEAA
jgi:hypothetical protein